MVLITALGSFLFCRASARFDGSASHARVMTLPIFSRSSAAAAFVKVTISMREMSAGRFGSHSRRISRSVSTAVFPEPAAAETSRSQPSASMAHSCASVHLTLMPYLPFFCFLCYCQLRAMSVCAVGGRSCGRRGASCSSRMRSFRSPRASGSRQCCPSVYPR